MKENATTFLSTPGNKLDLQVYNPGSTSVFPVSSTLIVGPTEVLLVDTQFQKNDTEEVVKLIKATGKPLNTVYISHGDPDYYFGTEVIMREFPDCNIIATKETVRHIKRTKDHKLSHWTPLLKHHAPRKVFVPQPLADNFFTIDGSRVEIVGPWSDRTYCWIPDIKTVVGGIAVFGPNMHLWLANNQSSESRFQWLQILTSIEELEPEIVIPSHFYPNAPLTIESVQFSKEYLTAVETELVNTRNSGEFTAAMKDRFPDLGGELNLEISAKVLKREMKWPTI